MEHPEVHDTERHADRHRDARACEISAERVRVDRVTGALEQAWPTATRKKERHVAAPPRERHGRLLQPDQCRNQRGQLEQAEGS